MSKNEVTCSALQDMLAKKDIKVNIGSLEESPSHYSPFHRSKTDLSMFHKTFFKQNVITSAVTTSSEDGQYSYSTSVLCQSICFSYYMVTP